MGPTDREGSMQGTDPIAEYRIRVITTGLIVTWLGFVLFSVWAFAFHDSTAVAAIEVGSAFIGLVLLTIAPWRRLLGSGLADTALMVWCVLALMGLLAFELGSPSTPTGLGLLIVVFFAAATLMSNLSLIVVGLIATVTHAIALLTLEGADTVFIAGSLATFVVAVLFILLLSIGIRTQLEQTTAAYNEMAEREAVLTRREREMSQLYDVSRTIGAGSKLDDVLPELIGRVASAVEARVGLVLLYEPETEHLDLMSPIWAAGHTVPADPFSLTLDEPSIGPRVFMSGDSKVINDVTTAPDDRLAQELDADRVAAVAMRVENRTIGVLLVGDKERPFTPLDLETLESVAAPAALVLNQMARYEAARTTGERMAELAEMKTDFVSVVSHELRTPLTSIIGALNTLQRPELLPEDQRAQQLIEMASKQSNRLRTLIEDLLVMSRIEAESLPVRPERIKLEPFLQELLEALPGGDRVDHESELEDAVVVADPDHLTRVVTNLVDNAIKYGGDSSIELTTSSVNGEIHLSVIDHGPGIPYEQHDRMFDRFTQLQPHATRSKGGAGLGLSIVRGLVEAMNGRVWFEPTIGGGATFTVAIPSR